MVVVSLLCTSSSSHSLAAALPFTPPPHPPPVLAMLRTLVVVLALAVVAFAQSSGSFTNTFYLSGGVPFCTQCGAQGQYACSSGGVGNWQSNFMVRDPVAPGSAVSGIEVALIGTAPNSLTPSRIHAIGSRTYSLTHSVLSLSLALWCRFVRVHLDAKRPGRDDQWRSGQHAPVGRLERLPVQHVRWLARVLDHLPVVQPAVLLVRRQQQHYDQRA